MTTRGSSFQRMLPALSVLSLLWFTAGCCYQHLPSADLWWLLADGRCVAQTGSIPQSDPFSWTAPGAAWHNDQWLAGLLFYALYGVGRLSALHLLKTALLLLTVGIAVDTGRRLQRVPSWPGLLLATALSLGASSAAFFFDVRAYLFTYLFLVVLWRWIQLGSRPPLWRVGLLFALWSNLHGGLSSGLLLMGFAVLFDREGRAYWTRALAVAVLSSCCNPSGIWILLHPLKLLGSPWQRYLNEWQPVWRRPGLFRWHLVHLAAWVMVWLGGRRAAEDRCLMALGLFSLTGWRHIPLFALLAIPRWCVVLQLPNRTLPTVILALVLMLSAGLKPLKIGSPAQSLEQEFFPYWACNFLHKNTLPERLFHPYGLGGYLLWQKSPRYRVCIDGRAVQVYPFSAYADYLRAAYSAAEFEKFCRMHDVRLALLFADDRPEASSRLIQPGTGWTELYRDGLVILVGRDLPETTLTPVETPYSLSQQALAEPAHAAELWNKALLLQPGYRAARFGLAVLQLRSGDPREMLELAREFPDMLEAQHALALFYRDRDPQRARDYARRVRTLAPGSDWDRSL